MASLGDILKGTAGAAFRGTKAVAGGAAALAMSGNPDALAAGFMTAQASRAVGAVKSGVIGGVKGAFNRAFGGGSGGTGASGSPTRTSGEQPLTEKTFQDPEGIRSFREGKGIVIRNWLSKINLKDFK